MQQRLTLGGRFLLIVAVVAVLPLGLAGVWLTRDAGRAGEALLEARMGTTLQGLADEAGAEWLRTRSRLLDLADVPEVRERLRAAAPGATAGPPLELATVSPGSALREIAHRLELRDRSGAMVGTLGPPPSAPDEGLRVTLPVHEPSGEVVGRVDAWLRLEVLLGRTSEWAARTGGVIGALEPGSELPILITPFAPHLITAPRFHLAGEEWITQRHTLRDPPAVLVLAAPLDPYREPFREAARRGVLLILALTLTGFAAAALLTRQTTRPLSALVTASEAVARGEMDRRVAVQGPREVSRLAAAFNAMAGDLQRTMGTLARREAMAAVGEFAAVLAHEIRNPLTAIRIDLQRVEEVSADEARRRSLTDRMLEAVRRLDRTVSGVLRVAGTGRVELKPVPLLEPLQAALESARPAIEGRGGALYAPTSLSDLPPVLADRSALEQLFLNLLLNAGEALEAEGERRVEVSVGSVTASDEAEAAPGFAEVRIHDTGRGIAAGVLERIFEPLYSTREGGTGLGLPIAERIARAHGGDIRVESEPGRGTTVTIRLPFAELAEGATPSNRPEFVRVRGLEAGDPTAFERVP
jgi:signal transduction histidine kinase